MINLFFRCAVKLKNISARSNTISRRKDDGPIGDIMNPMTRAIDEHLIGQTYTDFISSVGRLL